MVGIGQDQIKSVELIIPSGSGGGVSVIDEDAIFDGINASIVDPVE